MTMDMKGGGGENETAMRSRSFRNEDYNARRVFLRSYPLQWGDDEEEKEAAAAGATGGGGEKKVREETTVTTKAKECAAETSEGMKSCMKKIVMAAFQWRGEKGLMLRKFRHKFTLYFVTCIPVGFKAPTHAFISAT